MDYTKVSIPSVYNKGSFHLTSNYIIKTVEEVLLITSRIMEVRLITQNFINTYKEKYGYLHFGLVQVAIKSLN